MEYIVISLLVINLLILLVILFKGTNSDTIEKMGRLETNIVKEFGDFKNDLTRSLNEDFIKLNDGLENRLRHINDAVNERLDENFDKTNKTFTNVLERLSKIDEAQKKIDTLSSDIVSLQSILTDKKTRGIYGEVNLKNIMENVFGENNKTIYQLQYGLSNGTIVDCALFAPEPLGLIGIDSKFPLENYTKMVDRTLSNSTRIEATKLFKSDVKKHIDAIASKYIIPGVTSDQAILFLPAEAIFAEINAYHTDLIEYAYKKRVWLTSPTTLISTLTTIQVILMNLERDKYAKVIHDELKLLDVEFKRYKDRWDKLSRSIESVGKDVKELHTTSEKITKRFDSINHVEIDSLTYSEKE